MLVHTSKGVFVYSHRHTAVDLTAEDIPVTDNNKYRDVEIRAPRGNKLTAKSWLTEAPLRMLMNNLDPQVAENPKELVVYGGIGRAARNWECYDKIVETLTRLEDDETLLVHAVRRPADAVTLPAHALGPDASLTALVGDRVEVVDGVLTLPGTAGVMVHRVG